MDFCGHHIGRKISLHRHAYVEKPSRTNYYCIAALEVQTKIRMQIDDFSLVENTLYEEHFYCYEKYELFDTYRNLNHFIYKLNEDWNLFICNC
jgi:hypothetical protein